jgi:hypothetical protein
MGVGVFWGVGGVGFYTGGEWGLSGGVRLDGC